MCVCVGESSRLQRADSNFLDQDSGGSRLRPISRHNSVVEALRASLPASRSGDPLVHPVGISDAYLHFFFLTQRFLSTDTGAEDGGERKKIIWALSVAAPRRLFPASGQ